MNITFKNYDLTNDLDFFNKILTKASMSRYELRLSKNNKYYLYDYDEIGMNKIVRNKKDILDIIECQYMEDFINNKDSKRINKIIRELL